MAQEELKKEDIKKEETKKEISKSLDNPIKEATKNTDLSVAMSSAPKKKELLPDQISPYLSKYENNSIKERYWDVKQ